MKPAKSGETSLVLYEVTDRVATLTLNRLEKLNALTLKLLAQLLTGLGRCTSLLWWRNGAHSQTIRRQRVTFCAPAVCLG